MLSQGSWTMNFLIILGLFRFGMRNLWISGKLFLVNIRRNNPYISSFLIKKTGEEFGGKSRSMQRKYLRFGYTIWETCLRFSVLPLEETIGIKLMEDSSSITQRSLDFMLNGDTGIYLRKRCCPKIFYHGFHEIIWIKRAQRYSMRSPRYVSNTYNVEL